MPSSRCEGCHRDAAGKASPVGSEWLEGGARVVRERHVVGQKDEGEVTGRAVALLGDEDVGNAFFLGRGIVELLAVEEDDDVGVLLERPGFAKVRELWPAHF